MSGIPDTNDDFEKVDPLPDQEENVSSTGEIPEEDRYDERTPNGQNDVDLLGDFGISAGSGEAEPMPPVDPKMHDMMSFGTPIPETTVTESTPPPSEPAPLDVLSEAKNESAETESEGGWMKNVDPRDDVVSNTEPSLETMEDSSNSDIAKSDAQSDSNGPYNGVLDLIYWRDVKMTGIVFGSMMFILISLACFSLVSVLAYLSLAVLTVTFSFRVYKNVMQAVQKTNEGHPFKKLLDKDIELSEDVVQNAARHIAGNLSNCAKELRRLYLVEDYVDSLKFGLLLWLLTYIGSWFNGMTLIILGVVAVFTIPKVYETYQVQIDSQVNMARGQLNNIMAQVSSKIPFPKKKAKQQ